MPSTGPRRYRVQAGHRKAFFETLGSAMDYAWHHLSSGSPATIHDEVEGKQTHYTVPTPGGKLRLQEACKGNRPWAKGAR